jgi:hypothetical protein
MHTGEGSPGLVASAMDQVAALDMTVNRRRIMFFTLLTFLVML